ncbi:hypothetical protein FH972_023142 [Carpinus fangiana]|uniref:Uncharacterized protein n=1 Tax=Carpinus fangiana TaxID=176857 RepID=A0A5N6KUM5_9ROSI|nr:hypothetical protein FH972_023142 [Carpinus fangiana]
MPLLHRAVSTLFDHFLSTTQQAESDFPSSSTPLSGNLLPEHSKQQQPGASPFAHSNLLEQRQLHALAPRQNAVYAIPLSYDFSGPSAGTVVGIVLGIVGGIILIVVLFWAAFSVGPGGGGDELVVVANTDASHSDYLRSRRSRRRRSSKYEMRQHRSRSRSHSPPPPPRRPRTERIIVQETRRTESRPPPIQINVDSPLSPARSHRVPNDDVVEVIEEQSEISSSIPPPRRKSKRTSGSYRVVDPDAYAGGNYAPRDVYDDRRRSKR